MQVKTLYVKRFVASFTLALFVYKTIHKYARTHTLTNVIVVYSFGRFHCLMRYAFLSLAISARAHPAHHYLFAQCKCVKMLEILYISRTRIQIIHSYGKIDTEHSQVSFLLFWCVADTTAHHILKDFHHWQQ